MSLLLKALALRLVTGRTVGGVFSLLLLVLAPLAGVLKFIGLPILLVLSLVGAPLFLLLGAIGLPMLFVLGIGGALLILVGLLLSVGFAVLKVALPVLLVVWLVRRLFRTRESNVPAPAPPSAS